MEQYHQLFLLNSVSSFSWLDIAQKWAEIVTAGSFVVAIAAYFLQKWQNKMSSIADQISFFRLEILVKNTTLHDLIKSIDPTYKYPRLNLDIPTINASRVKYPNKSKEQADLTKQDERILTCQISLLNTMEELAIRVIYLKTKKHIALNSIRSSFVQLVEENMVILLMMREVIGVKSNFQHVINLYLFWKDGVDRRTSAERMAELTKELAKKTI